MAARARGKGYGAATIENEIKSALELLPGQPPSLAIDIGGNVGEYAATLRQLIPGIEVHIFEPSKTNIAKLRNRFENDGNVHVVPHAASENSGPVTLFSNAPGSGLGSLTKRNLEHHNLTFDVVETVEAVRFEDYWIAQLNRRTLDIVKIDVEGHELSALKGFGEAIRASKIIQFEFGGTHIDSKTFFRDFWYFFMENKFRLYRITPWGILRLKRYSEEEENFIIANYIAVNESLSA